MIRISALLPIMMVVLISAHPAFAQTANCPGCDGYHAGGGNSGGGYGHSQPRPSAQCVQAEQRINQVAQKKANDPTVQYAFRLNRELAELGKAQIYVQPQQYQGSFHMVQANPQAHRLVEWATQILRSRPNAAQKDAADTLRYYLQNPQIGWQVANQVQQNINAHVATLKSLILQATNQFYCQGGMMNSVLSYDRQLNGLAYQTATQSCPAAQANAIRQRAIQSHAWPFYFPLLGQSVSFSQTDLLNQAIVKCRQAGFAQ